MRRSRSFFNRKPKQETKIDESASAHVKLCQELSSTLIRLPDINPFATIDQNKSMVFNIEYIAQFTISKVTRPMP